MFIEIPMKRKDTTHSHNFSNKEEFKKYIEKYFDIVSEIEDPIKKLWYRCTCRRKKNA